MSSKLKERLAVASILMIIAGFGMIHSTTSTLEVVSLILIGIGSAFLLFLLLRNKGNQ